MRADASAESILHDLSNIKRILAWVYPTVAICTSGKQTGGLRRPDSHWFRAATTRDRTGSDNRATSKAVTLHTVWTDLRANRNMHVWYFNVRQGSVPRDLTKSWGEPLALEVGRHITRQRAGQLNRGSNVRVVGTIQGIVFIEDGIIIWLDDFKAE